jgi:excisionase family DNA binding protein
MSKEAPRPIPQSELGINPTAAGNVLRRKLMDPADVVQKIIDGEIQVFHVNEVVKMLRVSAPLVYKLMQGFRFGDTLRIPLPWLVDALTLRGVPEAESHEDMIQPPPLLKSLVNNLIDGTDSVFTVSEVSKMFKVSPPTVYKMIRGMGIVAICLGDTVRIPRSSLVDWTMSHLTNRAAIEPSAPDPDPDIPTPGVS